jgi:hypothetical protein
MEMGLIGTGKGNASFTAQLFSSENEPKLRMTFRIAHVTPSLKAILLMSATYGQNYEEHGLP